MLNYTPSPVNSRVQPVGVSVKSEIRISRKHPRISKKLCSKSHSILRSHADPSQPQTLNKIQTLARINQRTDAMKFPMLQIVIIAKVPPNEQF